MKVSVMMLAYNHERFIEQAIQSILDQRTDFDFELVVGEDRSTDRTADIVRRLQDAHPGRIRALLRPENLGMQRNFIETYKSCLGRYVAFLDGDDFLTDTGKLQAQADFLDANPDHAMCYHNALTLADDGAGSLVVQPGQGMPLGVEDLLLGNPIPPCSIFVRNGLVREFPEWVLRMGGMDWIFNILHAQHGKVGYIDRCMGRYRLHAGGIWSGKPAEYRVSVIRDIYKGLLTTLDAKYHRLINYMVYYNDLGFGYQQLSGAYGTLESEYHRVVKAYEGLELEYRRVTEFEKKPLDPPAWFGLRCLQRLRSVAHGALAWCAQVFRQGKRQSS